MVKSKKAYRGKTDRSLSGHFVKVIVLKKPNAIVQGAVIGQAEAHRENENLNFILGATVRMCEQNMDQDNLYVDFPTYTVSAANS